MTITETGLDALTPVDGLIVNLADGVLSVTIDRPESLNSLTPRVLDGLADAFERAATDPRVRVARLGGLSAALHQLARTYRCRSSYCCPNGPQSGSDSRSAGHLHTCA